MFCTDCGAQNKDEARFCVKCGIALVEGQSEEKPSSIVQSEEKPSSTKVLENGFSQKGVGFLKALFDFSFTAFVTSKIIKLLYGLSILFSGIIGLILLVIFLGGGFSESPEAGTLALFIGTPLCFLIFLVLVTYSRVLLEIIIVVFRIAENTSEIAQQGRIEKKHPDE